MPSTARMGRVAAAAAVTAIPAAALALILGLRGVALADFVPIASSRDDLFYWRQVYTFGAVGFEGGYYTVGERPARAHFSHFYAHGPFFPALYGTLARWLGWQLHTPVLFNAVIATLAVAALAWAARREPRRLAVCGLVVATSWPLLHYLVSSRPESLHHAMAIALALALAGPIGARERPPPLRALSLVGLLLAASLLRITWGLLLLPVALLVLRPRTRAGAAAIVGAAAAAFALLSAGVVTRLNAPYPPGFLWKAGQQLQHDWDASPAGALFAVVGATLGNAEANLRRPAVSPIVQVQRLQVAGLVLWLGAALIRSRASPERGRVARWNASRRLLAFNLYNLLAIACVVLLLYDARATRDYRVLAPHLLLSLCLLALAGRLRAVAAVCAVSLLALPLFASFHAREVGLYFRSDRAAIGRFREATRGVVTYDPQAPSAWCNTLLFSYRSAYQTPLAALPPGIGTSFFLRRAERLPTPLRSGYLLLNEIDLRALASRMRLERVADTELGALVLNRDSGCHDRRGG